MVSRERLVGKRPGTALPGGGAVAGGDCSLTIFNSQFSIFNSQFSDHYGFLGASPPDLSRWDDASVDDLMTISGLESFAKDQVDVDERIARLLGEG